MKDPDYFLFYYYYYNYYLIIVTQLVKTTLAYFRRKGINYCWDPFISGGQRVRPGVYLAEGSVRTGTSCKLSLLIMICMLNNTSLK